MPRPALPHALVSLMVLVICSARPARGQAPDSHPTGASVVAPGTAAPASASQPLPVESATTRRARELTLRGEERFAAGDYEAALSEFTHAYEAVTGDPRRSALLNNIAVCHERLFRYDLALSAYQRYLREAQTDAADRAEVEAVIAGLRGLLGKLHVTSNVSAEIWVDDRSVGFAPGFVEVPAGRRVIKLQAPGRENVQKPITVVARATRSVHFDLEPLSDYRGVSPSYFWTGAALTSASLIAGVGLGASAMRKRQELKDLRREGLLTDQIDQKPMLRQGLAADISFGAAALFGVSSTVLFFVSDFRARSAREGQHAQPAHRNTWIGSSVGARAAGLSLSGVFP